MAFFAKNAQPQPKKMTKSKISMLMYGLHRNVIQINQFTVNYNLFLEC